MKTETPSGALSRFFFQKEGPINLSVCRIAVFGYFALTQWMIPSGDWYRQMPEPFWRPIFFFELFGLHPPSGSAVVVLTLIWKMTLWSATLGFLTRVTAPIAFLLTFYFYGLVQCYWYISHGSCLAVLAMGILCLTPCGHALSIDSYLFSRVRRPIGVSNDRYSWGRRLIAILLPLSYLMAGLCKLKNTGLEWIIGENMHRVMVWHLISGGDPFVTDRILNFTYGPNLFAFVGVLFELLVPVLCFIPRYQVLGLLSLGIFQLSIYFIFQINFVSLSILYAAWVPWDRLGHLLSERRSS